MPEEVAQDAWRVDLERVNAYLVRTEDGLVAVDAGLPTSATDIREAIEAIGEDPADLEAVLVTHTDLDHVGGLTDLIEGTEATVYLSPIAAEILTGQRRPPWLNTKGFFQRVTNRFVDTPEPARMEIVDEGETVHGLRVLATPGHGLGHLAYAREHDGLVFIGDLVRLDRTEPRIAPGVINYDTNEAEESLQHLLETLDNVQVVCAGHGEVMVEDSRERLERLVG